jgi:thiol-disulfide isomerase/thioredoxin
MLDRRTLLAGVAGTAASAAAGPTLAATSPLARGVLADNVLARAFERPRWPRLPRVALWTPTGTRAISQLYGRTLLIAVWTEWCNPCMAELADFARLQTKYGNDKFAIVPILSGAKKALTTPIIAKLFANLHAEVFEPLVEVDWGTRLLDETAGGGFKISLPCHVLVAPDGQVVARQLGMPTGLGDRGERRLERTEGQEYVANAEAGAGVSLWSKAPGEEFAAAMADGFLTR